MHNPRIGHATVVGLAATVGGLSGVIVYWTLSIPSILAWMLSGALIGLCVGLAWPFLRSFALRHNINEWQLKEVDIQGLKFTSAGAQRRVAWRLFVEIVTRVSTQTLPDEDGDNGTALKSLHELFLFTRKMVSEMEPTPSATGDTVETFALDMLNSDLRHFLGKWQPVWDDFAKKSDVVSQDWPEHRRFREELRHLQAKIEGRARGLAEIAGLQNVDRFFPRI